MKHKIRSQKSKNKIHFECLGLHNTGHKREGQLSLQMIFFSAIVVVLVTGFSFAALSFLKLSVRSFNRSLAFSIAEGGIEYYRWHLAHAATDYWDGQGSTSTGPYVHDYYDKNGDKIGTFSLDIDPPPSGSTITTITSTGKVSADDSIEKTIRVKMGISSFAKFAVAANDTMRFGSGTEVFGEIMSNGRVRFDGLAHNYVRSALSTSTDTDSDACRTNVWGVHTCVAPADPSPPTALPAHTDVFEVGREVAVPALNFTGITQDLVSLRAQASSSGVYFPSSTYPGYELVFSTDDRYTVYRVNTLVSPPTAGCAKPAAPPPPASDAQIGWGTWSINTRTLIASGTIPASGIFFFEDDLWVRGQIDGARVTVVSGYFPDSQTTRTSITVNDNLLYSHYDGTDVVALIAQNNINIGMVASTTLRIDAAMIAQNGRVGRYYYRAPTWWTSGCSPYHTRNSITSYGMIGTNQRYGFAYTDGTGYQIRNLVYDANLLYGPPPGFPLTSDSYQIISWEEIR